MLHHRVLTPLIAGAVVACGLTVLARPAAAQSEERERMTKSLEVLDTLVKAPDDAIPEYILDRAEAIVIIPTLVKGGFVVGAEHGKGIMSVRNRTANSWSAPSFVALTGGSLGWQIGLQSVDLVLLVMNKEGIDKLLASEFKLGANASVAAGPVGRTAQAATDGKLTAEILAYSRAKGLFAGATIEGASLRDDADANRRFYGSAIMPKAIFADDIPKNRTDGVAAWRTDVRRLLGPGVKD
jgi:lipid-binding SYLF domain-containing protein